MCVEGLSCLYQQVCVCVQGQWGESLQVTASHSTWRIPPLPMRSVLALPMLREPFHRGRVFSSCQPQHPAATKACMLQLLPDWLSPVALCEIMRRSPPRFECCHAAASAEAWHVLEDMSCLIWDHLLNQIEDKECASSSYEKS